MGSRSNKNITDVQKAYIAGFIDGDGSLMLQLKKRSDIKRGYRFMVTICLYQDSRHEKELFWIRRILGIGYVSRRNDGISELRINGYAQGIKILGELLPYFRFKKMQAKALYRACLLMKSVSPKNMTKAQVKLLVEYILTIQNENYSTRTKKTKQQLYKLLDLTP